MLCRAALVDPSMLYHVVLVDPHHVMPCTFSWFPPCYVPLVGNVHVSALYLWLCASVSSCAHVPMFYHVPMLQPSITARGVSAEAPTGSCSCDGDVVIYVFDINQLNLPTLSYSVLMSVSVFYGLSTVFSFHNSSDNAPLSHFALPVLFLPYWSFQLHISLCKSPSALI